jgi:hypothetical protein
MGKALEQTLHKRGYIDSDNMKRCSMPLLIGEMQTGTTTKYYYIPTRMTKK